MVFRCFFLFFFSFLLFSLVFMCFLRFSVGFYGVSAVKVVFVFVLVMVMIVVGGIVGGLDSYVFD